MEDLYLPNFILSTVVIIGLLSASALICQKLKLPGIVGFIIAGVIIGPNGIAFIDSLPGANLIAELGVVFLLFTIGLELSLQTIRKNWRLIVTSGLGQVVSSVILFALVCHYLLSLAWPQSIIWGCLISLSSSAIVMKLLIDNRELTSTYGSATTGMLLSQDILVIPMTLGIPLLATGKALNAGVDISWEKLLLWGGQFIGVALFLFVSARYIVPFILERVARTKNRELFFFTILLLCLGCALVFEKLNLSLALGAFLSGLVISESHFGKQATTEIILLRDSFLALFFVSTGMLLDLAFVGENFFYIALFTLVTIVGKVTIGTVVAFCVRIPIRSALVTGLFIAQIGELSFVLAEVASEHKLLSAEHFQCFLAITIITMVLTPLIFRFAPRLIFRQSGDVGIHGRQQHKVEADVVIIGYGVAGQALAEFLHDSGRTFRIIEQNYNLIKQSKFPQGTIIYGDGSTAKTLHEAGFDQAKLVVVCVAGIVTTSTIVENIRRLQPSTPLLVRVQYSREAEQLLVKKLLDRRMIIDSENISSRRLVAKVKNILAMITDN